MTPWREVRDALLAGWSTREKGAELAMKLPVRTFRFIIEVWVEPREILGLPFRVRARVRDVEQGRTKYVGSMAEGGQMIEEGLDAAGLLPRRWEHEP